MGRNSTIHRTNHKTTSILLISFQKIRIHFILVLDLVRLILEQITRINKSIDSIRVVEVSVVMVVMFHIDQKTELTNIQIEWQEDQ